MDKSQLSWKDVWIAKGQKETYKILFQMILFTEDNNSYISCLNDEELEYFMQLQSKHRKLSYLFGRYSLKSNASDYIGENQLDKIHIRNGVFSQPIIESESRFNLQGTLSHCEICAASLVYNEGIILGLDIEDRYRDFKKIIANELTENEKKMLEMMSQKDQVLYGVTWTIKEAISKCLRTGFTIPLSILEIQQMNCHHHYIEARFKNFPQYKAISLILEEVICTIVYPANVEMLFNLENTINNMNQLIKERKRGKL